jgi:hypothetical protein
MAEAFRAEIGLLSEEGLFAAHVAGRLIPERVLGLDRLTRDPGALLHAREALTADASGPWGAAGGTAAATAHEATTVAEQSTGGFTSLVAAARWPELSERLRRYLPDMLRITHLSATLGEELRAFLVDRARTVGFRGRRFGEVLPEWLTAFAQQHRAPLPRPLTRDDWESVLEGWSVRTVLQTETPGEPEWACKFRELALRRGVASGQELLRMRLPEPYDRVPALPMFRRDLLSQAQKERDEALRFFELN